MSKYIRKMQLISCNCKKCNTKKASILRYLPNVFDFLNTFVLRNNRKTQN